MALSIFITITLYISYILFFIKKKLSFLQNSILYMVMTIITKNYMTIVSMELKLINTTEDPFLFLTLLLNREIINPLVTIIFVNLYFQTSTWYKRILLSILIIGFNQMLDVLSIFFEVQEYLNWNMFYSMLVNISYVLIGLGVGKLLIVISKREGKSNERNI